MVPMEQCGAVAQGFAEPLALPVAVHDAIVHRVIGNVIVEAEAVLMTHGQPANALLVSIPLLYRRHSGPCKQFQEDVQGCCKVRFFPGR